MDLQWSGDDLAWGQRLSERLGQVPASDRLRLWNEAGIAAAVLPGAASAVADPPRAMITMQALGSVLATELPVETLVMAAHLLSAAPEGAAISPIGPERQIAVAWMGSGTDDPFFLAAVTAPSGWVLSGVAPMVFATGRADEILVGARCGLQALLFRLSLRAPGLSSRGFPTLDGGDASELTFAAVRVDEACLLASGEVAERAMQRAIAVATALACARACGMMRYLVEATVNFLRNRRQFGRTLSEFQVLQHRAVDMLIETELAEAATLRALLSLEFDERRQALAIAAAKATASSSARFLGQNAIQLHGGKGMDARTPATAYFRALTAFELSFGLASQHLERLATLET